MRNSYFVAFPAVEPQELGTLKASLFYKYVPCRYSSLKKSDYSLIVSMISVVPDISYCTCSVTFDRKNFERQRYVYPYILNRMGSCAHLYYFTYAVRNI